MISSQNMMTFRYNDDLFAITYLNGLNRAQRMNGPDRARAQQGPTNERARVPGPTGPNESPWDLTLQAPLWDRNGKLYNHMFDMYFSF